MDYDVLDVFDILTNMDLIVLLTCLDEFLMDKDVLVIDLIKVKICFFNDFCFNYVDTFVVDCLVSLYDFLEIIEDYINLR